ncbi:MAG TPA: hypothetical protein VK502_00140 [Candidatus Saccharimonadales bacterium]|nr:hypothetical protein [Candidatus Saccharimonadales bacterium]
MALDLNKVTDVTLYIAALLVTIAPLLGTYAVLKGIKGVADKFDIPVPGEKFGKKAQDKADDFRKRQQGRNAINALNSNQKFRPGFGKYRREARRDAISGGIEAERKRAQQQYVAGQMTNKNGQATGFANKVAGGGGVLGAKADASALQRALAGAKFTIERAEAEEVKAHHATIDNLDATALKNVIANSKSDTEKAAAIERLMKVGSAEEKAEVVDQFGGNGKNDVINKTLANSLREDGPGFLKASDIDNIGRGKGGKMADIASKNIEDGVYTQEKMVAASPDELIYASAHTTEEGQYNLGVTAGKVKANPNLSGKIKHNTKNIDELEATGITTYRSPPRP